MNEIGTELGGLKTRHGGQYPSDSLGRESFADAYLQNCIRFRYAPPHQLPDGTIKAI
jgi:hypothetical protein